MAKEPQPVYYTIFKTEWGYFGLAATKDGLVRTLLPQPNPEKVKSNLLKNFPAARYKRRLFNAFQQQIIAYFRGASLNFSTDVPLVLDRFGPFTKRVLLACRKIPFGQKISYLELAKKIRCPAGSRAVAGALARNPLPLIIPCHRVICSNGKIGGFSTPGGVTLKKRILQLEQKAIVNHST
jgi:methylated-DNA-[protein]-cysteine S-methyltransferase